MSEDKTSPQFYSRKAHAFVHWCAILYGVYAFFLLIEVLDFLAMLHTAPPEGEPQPTYDIVNVAYYIVEMVVCITIAFYYLILPAITKSSKPIIYSSILIAVFRIVMIYYLYIFTTPEYRWVPYIYKVANEFSETVRVLFLPAHVILGLLAARFWWKHGDKFRTADSPA